MAGVGFALRKLVSRGDLPSQIGGYLLAGFITAGPWLFTILALAATNMVVAMGIDAAQIGQFRLILIYNFAISLVATGPIVIVTTRYVADRVYLRRFDEVPAALWYGLIAAWLLSLVVALPFYLLNPELSPATRLAAFMNFTLVSSVWCSGVLLSALRGYGIYAVAFCAGMALAMIGSSALGPSFGTAGLLQGFNLGLAVIVFVVVGRSLAEFEYPFQFQRGFWMSARKYWDLALYGLFAAGATWIDKWMMWFAPESRSFVVFMPSQTNYDYAMFLVYLTIIPGLTMLLVFVETGLQECVQRYYDVIESGADLSTINAEAQGINRFWGDALRKLVLVQGPITLACILGASSLLPLLGALHSQTGIFRLGVLGAFFHLLILFMTAVFIYLDLRRIVLRIHVALLLLNAALTAVTIGLGFAYYGLGYFLSTMVIALVTVGVAVRVFRQLPYYTFMVNNATNR